MENFKKFIEKLISNQKFIYLFTFIFLGTALFYGLTTGGKLMRSTAESYLNRFDLEDIKLVSSHGIGEEELKLINDSINPSSINVGYQVDAGIGGTGHLLSVESMPESWVKFDLIEGTFPEKPGQIAIDSDLEGFPNQIGDKISLSIKGDNPMMRLNAKEFTIVGKISSPEYILKTEKGTSNFTGSSLDGYALILPEDFRLEKPNFARILLKGTENLSYFSNDYKAIVDNESFNMTEAFAGMPEKKIEIVKKEASQRIVTSLDEIKSLENERISRSEKAKKADEEIKTQREEYKTRKDSFDTTLAKSLDLNENGPEKKKKLDEEVSLLEKNQKEIQGQYDDQATKVDEVYAEFEPTKVEYENLSGSIDARQAEVDDSYAYANSRLADISSEIADLRRELSTIRFRSYVAMDGGISARISELNGAIGALQDEEAGLEARLAELGSIQAEIDADRASLAAIEGSYYALREKYEAEESVLKDFQQSLDELNADLEKKSKEKEELGKAIVEAKDFLEKKKEPEEKTLIEMKSNLDKADQSYKDNTATYQAFMKDSAEEIKVLQAIIARSEEEKASKIKPTYDIESSSTNAGMDLYSSVTERVDMMTEVFPHILLIFSSITAAVLYYSIFSEKDDLFESGFSQGLRENSGLLLKLGKLTGAGLVLGLGASVLLSYIIFGLYGQSFTFSRPSFNVFPIQLGLVILGPVLGLGLALLASYMNIVFDFNLKIENKALKNLLDHPMRFMGTILGLAASTSLLFTGLALSREVRNLAYNQYSSVVKYHAEVQLPENLANKELDDFDFFLTDVKKVRDIRDVMTRPMSSVKEGYPSVDFKLIVPAKTDGFDVQMDLRDSQGRQVLIPEEGIIISRKMAEILEVKEGDVLAFTLDGSSKYEAQVGGIFNNYISDFAYISPASYKKLTGQDPVYTQKNIVLKDASGFAIDNFVKEAAEFDYVQTVNTVKEAKSELNTIIKPLNFIALIYIGVGLILVLLTLLMQVGFVMDNRLREIGLDPREDLGKLESQHFIQALIGLGLGLGLGTGIFKVMTFDTVRDNIRITSNIYWIDYVVVGVVSLVLASFLYVQKSAKYNKNHDEYQGE